MLTILSERLREVLGDMEMSFSQLAEKADIPLETVRNLYYGKVKDPKVSTLLKISSTLNVSVNYLLGGKTMSEEEIELITNFRKCGSHGKSLLLLLGKYEAEMTQHEKKNPDKRRIPCIIPVGEVKDGLPFHGSETIDLHVVDPKAYLAIEVNSNHFSPIYCKGDKVLLQDRFPRNGEKAIFTKDCMIYCRTFIEESDGYILKSLNRFGTDFHLKRMDEVECWGTCIGIVRE